MRVLLDDLQQRHNMKDKNFDLDRWYSSLRAPYERVFSNQSKRTRYRGIAKNQFHAFMQTIAFNLKRLVVLTEENAKFSVQNLNLQPLPIWTREQCISFTPKTTKQQKLTTNWPKLIQNLDEFLTKFFKILNWKRIWLWFFKIVRFATSPLTPH